MAQSLLQHVVKRTIDVTASCFGIWATLPLVLAAGAAVKIDSDGPVLFRSPRVGKDRKLFHLYKLRSMQVASPDAGPQVTAGTDDRITRVGRFLRKTKIDELPQLFNVLKGEISLVGPRPEAPKYVAMYPREYDKILSVKPGLSDRATLEFVGEEELLSGSEDPEKRYIEEIMPRKMAHYLRYVDSQNLLEDIDIIARTLVQIAGRTLKSLRGKL
jgi:lipopolysaccharide/colanic/teichoic acid biosynthesis glycosyltransferase